MQNVLERIIHSLPGIFIAILIIIIFWFLSKFAIKLIQRIKSNAPPQRQPAYLVLEAATKMTIILLGVITALGSAGVNISALVASLGISGIALTLASKDAFSNLFAGVLVLIYQPFDIGDIIEVDTFKGEVIKMSLRYTHLKDEHKEILIPNASLLTNNIVINHQ